MSFKDWKYITEDFRTEVSKHFKSGNLPEIHTKELVKGKPPFDRIAVTNLLLISPNLSSWPMLHCLVS